jgi:SAM-dependent methyltransferase
MFETRTLLEFMNTTGHSAPAPEPAETVVDLTGYEALVDLIRREKLDQAPGDFLEIGCFLGGGTAKLAQVAAPAGKRVWVVDVFDPSFDITANRAGDRISDLYRRHLRGRTQEEIFQQVTAPWSGLIHLFREDSMKVRLPDNLRLAFAFVDGNHNPEWVKSDFNLVWQRLNPGGWAGFHDYAGDFPEITTALNTMMTGHQPEIGRVERIKDRWILLVQKRPNPGQGKQRKEVTQ